MIRFMRIAALAFCMVSSTGFSCAYVVQQIKENSMRTPDAVYGSAKTESVPGKNAPATVYVTFRNHCETTVKLFFGEKPPYSSGVETSVSGNSVDARTIAPGTPVWILDDSGKPVSNTTVSEGTSEIHINKSGTGFGED